MVTTTVAWQLNTEVVSFDIFDTLLVRPYVTPSDMFMHMERACGIPGFYYARVNAENTARQKHPDQEDITLDQIYAEIAERFKSFQPTELEWERMVLRPNPLVLPLWRAAVESGKKIIITSDMYLPADFLADVLTQNGFGEYSHLYVSCEIGKTKSRGSLYKHIIDELNISPSVICHIGDNKHSDIGVAKQIGIQTIHIPRIVDKYLNTNHRAAAFYSQVSENLGASILTAMMARHQFSELNHDYWENLGYEYGGPAAYSFMRWVLKTAREKDINNILFVARDGYTLQRVFNTFGTDIHAHYVYAPRYLNLICRLDYRTDKSSVATAQQRTIINHYAAHNESFGRLVANTDFTRQTMADFLSANRDILAPLAAENFKKYQNYLKSMVGDDKQPAIIDSITENFSAQLLIDNALPDDTIPHGMYWYTIHNRDIVPPDQYSAFFNSSSYLPVRISHWPLMEFLLTSPEFPIEGIDNDGRPIYKQNISDEERHIRTVYPVVSDGMLSFANDVRELFGNRDIYLDYDTVICWLNEYINRPGRMDRKCMGTIKTATNPNNDSYASLFGTHISTGYVIRHPFKALRMAKNAVWRTPLQTLSVCLFDPIKINMRGLRMIKINIFPKLRENYANIKFSVGQKHEYSIILGKAS